MTNETIELDITEEEVEKCVKSYAKSNLSTASIEVFDNIIEKEGIKSAIYQATFNEYVIKALEYAIQCMKKTNPIDCYVITTLDNLALMEHGDRYFCLAHFYVQHEHYRKYFLDKKKQGAFITLDNSAAEKSLVTEEILLDIVEELQPNEVIAPDVLFDKEQTLENLKTFIKEMKFHQFINNTKIFACPQGNSKEEWIECYNEMRNNPTVSVIGLSKISVPRCFGGHQEFDVGIKESRQECIQYLIDNNLLTKPVHLLGMGDPNEYLAYDHPMIRSTDSCYSVLAAVNNILFKEHNYTRVKTTNDFYEKTLTNEELNNAVDNIDHLKYILHYNATEI